MFKVDVIVEECDRLYESLSETFSDIVGEVEFDADAEVELVGDDVWVGDIE